MRRQMFLDGNKRTAMLAANQVMVSNGCGVISVPIEDQPEFTHLLVSYYESGDMEEIKGFVYENCIDGIDFRLNETLSSTPEESDPTLTM